MMSINTETPRQKQMYLYSGCSLPFGQAAQILVALGKPYLFIFFGVRQMQTADFQTRAWVSQTRTSVSQTSALYRYRYRYI